MGAVDLGRRLRHRGVEVHRDLGDPARIEEPAQLPHDLLRPPDRERRDQQHALAPDGLVDDVGEDVDRRRLAPRARGRRTSTRTGRCRPRSSASGRG